MQLRSGEHVIDAYRPTFDPHLDIATVVFSHVQCVKTRVNLAVVSKLWRDASKPAAAYPLRFDFGAFPDVDLHTRSPLIIRLLDNDEALSLPYERVVGLLGEMRKTYVWPDVCYYAALRGSVRVLKWTRENNRAWGARTSHAAAQNGHLLALKYLRENGCPWDNDTCFYAAGNGHLPALQYLRENGCRWDEYTCGYATQRKHWDCLQYAVDNKCPEWEYFAEKYAEHLR